MKSPSFLPADLKNKIKEISSDVKRNILRELEAFASERLHHDPVNWTQIISSTTLTPPLPLTYILCAFRQAMCTLTDDVGEKGFCPFFKGQKLRHSAQNGCYSINLRAFYSHKSSYCFLTVFPPCCQWHLYKEKKNYSYKAPENKKWRKNNVR